MSIEINEKYAPLTPWIKNLPKEFDETGRLVQTNGRNVIKSFVVEDRTVVAKMCKVRNIFQKIYYSFKGQSKAHKAYENALLLQRCGILTPSPIAFFEEYRWGLLQKSCYLTEYVDWHSMNEFADKWSEPLMDAFVLLLAQMHKHGIIHHDLNRSNVLYRTDGNGYELMLIDINRLEQKKTLRFADYMDDLVRFSSDMGLCKQVFEKYAAAMGLEVEPFIHKSLKFKAKHDKRWTRKKRILRFFCISK